MAGKRDILSRVASVYVPLDFTVSLLLEPRRTRQQLCRKICDCDETIDEGLRWSLETWLEGITGVKILWISRCLSIELRLDRPISDAPESGYGAVAYMRLE